MRLSPLEIAVPGKSLPLHLPHHVAYPLRMRLSPDALREFRDIYREEFGENLPDAQMEETALRLLQFFKVLLDVPQQPGSHPVANNLPEGTHKNESVR